VQEQEVLNSLAKYLNDVYPSFFSSKLDFAVAVNVDEKTIRRILKGEQNISLKILCNISAAINKTPSDVLRAINL